MDSSEFTTKIRSLEQNISTVIKGKPGIVQTAIAALISRSHMLDESILDYILAIINETRNPKLFELGVSPRGALALKSAAQSRALADGRDYCIPDDVKEMALPVLAHRVVLRSAKETGGEEEAIYAMCLRR